MASSCSCFRICPVSAPTSVRGWLPGPIPVTETIPIADTMAAGEYALALAIVDPATRVSAIRLAIAGRADDGWVPLSRVQVRE